MVSKREARERRKALEQERFEAQKITLLANIHDNSEPRLIAEPTPNKAPRLAPHLSRIADQNAQAPKAIEDGSRFRSQVTWCKTKADIVDSWSWGDARAWHPEEWDDVISPPFQCFAQLTWQEIDRFSSESGHKMHHGHEVGDLVFEAQQRWLELDLEQYDSVFRFRLGGTKRVWGFIVQAHFHIVSWDRSHSIYPTEMH